MEVAGGGGGVYAWAKRKMVGQTRAVWSQPPFPDCSAEMHRGVLFILT